MRPLCLVEGDVGEAAVATVSTDDGLGGAAEEAAGVAVLGPDAVFIEVDDQGARGEVTIGEGVGGGAVVAGDLLGADVDAHDRGTDQAGRRFTSA